MEAQTLIGDLNEGFHEGQVVVSVRMSSVLRDFARDQAKAERRTVSSWIASRVGMAYDTARGEREATMREVMGKLELIHALLVVSGSNSTRTKEKTVTPRKDKWEALYNMPLDAADGGEIMTRESWKDWIDHLRKMKYYPIEEYTLKKNLELFEEHYNGYFNIDYLVSDLIKRNSRSVYIHSELMNEFKQEGKRR